MAAAASLSPNAQSSGRPGSPTTTLKKSIASSEVKLAEERNRQKRERKDQRAKLNSARKEIEKLASNISSSGGNDDRLRQKVQQSNLHMKQAEDALASIAAQIETLDAIPSDDNSEWKSEKHCFQSQKDIHKQARHDFHTVKQAAERDIHALSNEVATLQQKRERMQSRIAKLNGEHERITDANARGLDEAQRKASERQAKEAERAKMEMLYLERHHTLASQITDTTANLQALFATIETLQQADMYAAAQQTQQQSSPTTASIPALGPNPSNPYDDIPEGTVPNPAATAYPWNPFPGGSYGFGGASMLVSTSAQGQRTRGRSSSMLSNVSGFTQSSGEGGSALTSPPPPTQAQPQQPPQMQYQLQQQTFGKLLLGEKGRQRSDGGGSTGSASASGSGFGSGSGSRSSAAGSVGDPKSPAVGKAVLGGGSGSWSGTGSVG